MKFSAPLSAIAIAALSSNANAEALGGGLSLPSVDLVADVVSVASSVLYGLLDQPTATPVAEGKSVQNKDIVGSLVSDLESAVAGVESTLNGLTSGLPVVNVVVAAVEGVVGEVEKVLDNIVGLASSLADSATGAAGATAAIGSGDATAAVTSALGNLQGTLSTATSVISSLNGLSA